MRINELTVKCLDRSISEQEFRELDHLLLGDAAARDHYRETLAICVWMNKQKEAAMHKQEAMADEFNATFWEAMLQEEKAAPAIAIAKQPERMAAPEPVQVVVYRTSRASLFTALISSAALLFLIAYVQICPHHVPRQVATINDGVDILFGNNDTFSLQSRITNRTEPLYLKEGIIEVELDAGAVVVIESPAEFRFESSEKMILNTGRLYAKVPQQATGFIVQTPTSKVIDLGTEFGIEVGAEGVSAIHTFKGKVSLIPEFRAGVMADSEILTAGSARSVDVNGQVTQIAFRRQGFASLVSSQADFVWRGQKTLDLADMAGGGNGLGSGPVGVWLNLKTGQEGTDLPLNPLTQMAPEDVAAIEKRFTENRYMKASHLRYVDGVFSPDGSAGEVQVSSKGDRWTDCPDTSGIYFEDIFNGSYISTSYGHNLVLNNQPYGTKEHPAIALHSNAGITFDLNAIRAAMPGLKITRFISLFGVSQDADLRTGGMNFYVLVGGKKRFESLSMKAESGAREVAVELSSQDRFLTLVVTDGDLNPSFDWGMFAMPRLEIEP